MIDGMLDIFGTRLTLAFAAIALLYLLWSTAPIWWPALRVLMHRGRLPHPLANIIVPDDWMAG